MGHSGRLAICFFGVFPCLVPGFIVRLQERGCRFARLDAHTFDIAGLLRNLVGCNSFVGNLGPDLLPILHSTPLVPAAKEVPEQYRQQDNPHDDLHAADSLSRPRAAIRARSWPDCLRRARIPRI